MINKGIAINHWLRWQDQDGEREAWFFCHEQSWTEFKPSPAMSAIIDLTHPLALNALSRTLWMEPDEFYSLGFEIVREYDNG